MKAWICVTPDGHMLGGTLDINRNRSMDSCLCQFSDSLLDEDWPRLYRRGYRCVRCTVTVEVDDAR